MIRLLGAITGSALALAALLVLVGVPQFKAAKKTDEAEVVSLPLRAEPLAPVMEFDADTAHAGASEATALQSNDLPEEKAAAETAAQEENTETVAESVATDELETETPVAKNAQADTSQDTGFATEALQIDSPQWYAFWSPFRSEIAASGFVSRLQSVTGLDFRVIKLKPGVYEVAFAYAADEDIPLNLSQISAATGLDLPGN